MVPKPNTFQANTGQKDADDVKNTGSTSGFHECEDYSECYDRIDDEYTQPSI